MIVAGFKWLGWLKYSPSTRFLPSPTAQSETALSGLGGTKMATERLERLGWIKPHSRTPVKPGLSGFAKRGLTTNCCFIENKTVVEQHVRWQQIRAGQTETNVTTCPRDCAVKVFKCLHLNWPFRYMLKERLHISNMSYSNIHVCCPAFNVVLLQLVCILSVFVLRPHIHFDKITFYHTWWSHFGFANNWRLILASLWWWILIPMVGGGCNPNFQINIVSPHLCCARSPGRRGVQVILNRENGGVHPLGKLVLTTLQSEMFFPAFHGVSCQTGNLCPTARGRLERFQFAIQDYFCASVMCWMCCSLPTLPIYAQWKEGKIRIVNYVA